MTKTERQESGEAAEDRAQAYLESAGLRTLARNWSSRLGELDLVMRDGETIVFVEVRYRTRSNPVDPLETVDRRKQRRIARTADAWLQRNQCGDPPARFDVVAIAGGGELEWVRDAFDLD